MEFLIVAIIFVFVVVVNNVAAAMQKQKGAEFQARQKERMEEMRRKMQGSASAPPAAPRQPAPDEIIVQRDYSRPFAGMERAAPKSAEPIRSASAPVATASTTRGYAPEPARELPAEQFWGSTAMAADPSAHPVHQLHAAERAKLEGERRELHRQLAELGKLREKLIAQSASSLMAANARSGIGGETGAVPAGAPRHPAAMARRVLRAGLHDPAAMIVAHEIFRPRWEYDLEKR
jgi:hypothetical protein